MGRYVDLAKEIETGVSCGEPARELSELSELRVGTEPVQAEAGEAARWGEAARAVEWFLASESPAAPFQLKPGITILDPHRWRQSITADIAQGPSGPRARYGALQDDLKRLHAMFSGGRGDTNTVNTEAMPPGDGGTIGETKP